MSAGTFAAPAAPLDIGPLTLANRIVMGSMNTGLEGATDEAGYARMARFYAERAKGGAGLIVTGGYCPNPDGRLKPEDLPFSTPEQARGHRHVTAAVHAEGGHIVLQLVHAGRYAFHEGTVAPSAIRSPINRTTPRAMTETDIAATIAVMASEIRSAGRMSCRGESGPCPRNSRTPPGLAASPC